MQSRNWTSVGSSQQKESRLLYFGRRGLRLRTGGRELIGHPDQLGQGPGTHFSHHLAAMHLHGCLPYTGNATACLDRGVGPGPLFSEKTQPQLQAHAAGPGRGNHRVLRQHAIVNCSWSGSISRVCPKMVGQKSRALRKPLAETDRHTPRGAQWNRPRDGHARGGCHQLPANTTPRALSRCRPARTSPRTSRYSKSPSASSSTVASPIAPTSNLPISVRPRAAAGTVNLAAAD